ncbi:sensor histidine kinase [Sphaerisporangium rubeum]|uniref:sensor histidine kinase n=1 Tax=Sphaerisporangium rubeum TaxID=321317 RepID=UPI0031B56BF3
MTVVWDAVTSLWAEPAGRNPPARGRGDRVYAALVVAGVVLETVLRRDLAWRPVAVVFGCGLAVAVLFRRTHPLPSVAFAFGTFAALDVAAFVAGTEPMVLYSGWVVLVLAYSLFRWRAGRDAAVGLVIMAVAVGVSAGTDFGGVAETITGAAVLLCAAALGVSVRHRGTAREQLVEQAKLHEREELARELHDTVAHHVSAIAIQAQAGLFLARSSSLSGATEALETIDREAARTLAEMRTMVGALRDRRKQPAVVPQRRIADIERLAANSTDSLRIDVELRGELTDLPPALEAAIYRVTQESVTNAQRHAQQATRVEVKVTGSATTVRLTVSDDGARTTRTPNQAGYGLVGMTERVRLFGGTLTAGPNPDGGWHVRAVLPRQGSAT